HSLPLERPYEGVAAAQVDGRDARGGRRGQRRLGDDRRQRADRGKRRRAGEAAAPIEKRADAELDGQHGEQHDATSHRLHYNRRATSTNSRMSKVSALRPGSTPALAAASRAAPTGRPRPAVSAFAKVLRRWAKAARTTASNRCSSASGTGGVASGVKRSTADSTFGG